MSTVEILLNIGSFALELLIGDKWKDQDINKRTTFRDKVYISIICVLLMAFFYLGYRLLDIADHYVILKDAADCVLKGKSPLDCKLDQVMKLKKI